MVACVALRLGGRSPVPTLSVSCNCSSNPNFPAPSCSYLLGPWANGSSALQGQQTKSTLYQSSRPFLQTRQEFTVELGASTSEISNWGKRARRNKDYGPLRVTNASQEAEPSVQSNHSNGQTSGNGAANGAVHKQALSRVEWWRIDGRGGVQTSLESTEAGPSQSNAVEDSVMGPRGRTVGWIREEHSENGRANEEELWTWQAATQTLHLNGTAMHGRLKSWNSWAEESREESVVSSEGSGGAVVTQGLVSRSVTSGNESSVYASDSSQNGALRSSQNGASGSSNGVSKLAGNENGYAGSVQAENGRAGREALGGGQSTSDSEGAVAGAHSENEAGSKKKLKKDGKKAKKAAKAALENVKKKGKKKKGKGVALEESVMEVAQTSEAEAADKPPSSFVHVNGVRMYPGPGYVDRMESKFSDVLTSLSEAVKLDKQTDRAAAVAEQPSQNGAAKTEPPAENLEERLRDLRRKAIEHKARHDGEKGTLVVPTKQPILVLMRHGQSMWNELKLFTGDVDIPLTEKGVMEALSGGRTIKDVDFDIVFTSRLLRAKQTAMLALTQNSSHVVPVLVRGGYYGNGRIGDGNRLRLREAAMYALDKAACKMVPVFAHPALNERCYGDLQGLNKEEAAKEFGKELVQQWRRSNDTSPPGGESLVDTARRARKYYVEVIEPRLREGKNVLVVTHGNVMRGLIAHLANLEEEEMLTLEISTAFPYAYAFSRESDAYAQCCLMKPMEDFITGEPLEDKPMGLASVLKKKNFDSLI